MDNELFANKNLMVIITVIVVASILIYSIFFTSVLNFEKEGDINDWTNYPYVIPNTDMRFPDEEGLYAGGLTWISLGMELEIEGLESITLIVLYHPTYKDVFVDIFGQIIHQRIRGTRSLAEGKMLLTFESEGLERDLFKGREKAFQYDYFAHYFINNNEYKIDVELISTKPPATMFDGEVRTTDHYYRLHSLTNCLVTGNMEINGEVRKVTGYGWIENQRGNFMDMRWNWFAGFLEDDIEIKLVDIYGTRGERIQYIMYVHRSGMAQTIDDITIETTSYRNNYGHTWDIYSKDGFVSLNITSIEDRMHYSGFAAGIGTINGTIMGREINEEIYIELKP